jgi:hypothetical protein
VTKLKECQELKNEIERWRNQAIVSSFLLHKAEKGTRAAVTFGCRYILHHYYITAEFHQESIPSLLILAKYLQLSYKKSRTLEFSRRSASHNVSDAYEPTEKNDVREASCRAVRPQAAG